MNLNNFNILVDPYLSNSVQQLDSSDLKRMMDIPFKPEELINIDWVLITHDHMDHCDPHTIPIIAKSSKNSKFIGPEPVRKLFKNWGINEERIFSASSELIEISQEISIKSLPAAHPTFALGKDNTTTEGQEIKKETILVSVLPKANTNNMFAFACV